MESGAELSERKKRILKAVVEAHIDQGEPIGSKYLMQNQQIPLSSATIRNEMAELEEMGYLEQPHTSAGRIPSEAGYRFYVDSLMQSYDLTSGELRELNNLVKAKTAELDKILDRAGQLVSTLTNYTSLAVRPRFQSDSVAQFRTMYFDAHSFLLVIVITPDHVKTRYLHTDLELTPQLVKQLEEALNQYLTNIPFATVTLPRMMELERRLGSIGVLVGSIVKCVYEVLGEFGGDLKLDGVEHLLAYPECADITQLRGMLGAIENKEDIVDLVSSAKTDGVNVLIGSENPLDASHNSTLIFKTIESEGHTVGAIGVIGPRRMDYSKVITTVEYLSGQIASMLGNPTLPLKQEEKGGTT